MFQIRLMLIAVGGLLIGLGLAISLQVVAASAVPVVEPTLSPFDQGDDVISPGTGSAPLIAPTTRPLTTDPAIEPWLTLTAEPGQPSTLPPLSPTPVEPNLPDRLVIPAIHLDAPIVQAKMRIIKYQGDIYSQWMVPDAFAVGWSPTSAALGAGGNTVLFGHHNEYGEVFGHLVDLQVNDVISLYSGQKVFNYVIALKMILRERDQPVDVRLQNAAWILPSKDERLTLLTCWPYTTNTHRLIIVAVPITPENLRNYTLKPRFSVSTATPNP